MGWVVNITPRPLYPAGKEPRFWSLNMRHGGFQGLPGSFGEEKVLVPLLGIEQGLEMRCCYSVV